MTLFTTQNIEIRHGTNTVLRDMNLAIEQSEIVTIVGPNGSGKSSLLRALIRAIRPTRGIITRKPGLNIGYVPQQLHIDPTLPMTVRRFCPCTAAIHRGIWTTRSIKPACQICRTGR